METQRIQIILVVMAAVACLYGSVLGALHNDPDTNKWIEDGFDVRLYAEMPDSEKISRLAFGKGGSFGDDMYVATGDKIYRVDSSGQVSLLQLLKSCCGRLTVNLAIPSHMLGL